MGALRVGHLETAKYRGAPLKQGVWRRTLWRVLNYGGMLALLGAEKMMHTLPMVWPR
jgi:hypothetical protein